MDSGPSCINDHFDRVFQELVNQYITGYSSESGLLPRLRRLFVPRNTDTELNRSLNHLLKELEYWKFLRKLLIYIHKFSNATNVVQNFDSLFTRFEAVSDHEIAKDLSVACQKKYMSLRPSKALDVLRNSQTKLQLFSLEIQEALHLLSAGSSSLLEWQSPLLDVYFWFEYLRSTKKILGCISWEGDVDGDQLEAFKENIKSLRHFSGEVMNNCPSYHSEDPEIPFSPPVLSPGFQRDHITHDFFAYIASVAVRIINQSFHYWINKTDSNLRESSMVGLLDLQRHIDPTTAPEFLELNLKLLRDLKSINMRKAKHALDSFLDYMCLWVRNDDLAMELKSLIIFVINEPPQESNVTGQSFFDEFKAVLTLAGGSFYREMQPHIPSSELHIKICLLKVEVFLQKQLKRMRPAQENKIEDLNKILNNLRRFSKDLPHDNIENGKQSFALIKQVTREVSSLFASFDDKKVTKDRARISLLVLLLKIVLFKAESSCLGLLNGDAHLATFGKDQIETILEGLKLFTSFVSTYPGETPRKVELIFSSIEAVARRATVLYHSFLVNKASQDMTDQMVLSFSDLQDKMKLTKAEIREICPQIPRSDVPKTDGLGFIDFLLRNLMEILKRDPDSIALVKHRIEDIRLDLEFLRSFLGDVIQPDTEHLELKDISTRTREVAYEVEYIIDSIEVGIGAYWQHAFWLSDLLEEMRLIKMKASDFYEEKTSHVRCHSVPQISSHMTSHTSTTRTDEVLICLEDQEETIIDQLTRGSMQRDIVSVVGMPGIGKTTLAKKLYSSPKVTYHFHIQAWCSVSQVYGKRELLLEILREITALTDDIDQVTDEDLEVKLYQELKGNRYLIIMDDVWDTRAWNDLERSFPDDGNGSRILMTSRLQDVALKAKPGSETHLLRPLSDVESWNLIELKLFPRGCPQEYLEVGQEIAKNCKGLPLAVVAIISLLQRTEKKQEKWKEIAATVSSWVIDDPQTRCMDIFQLSYKQLPDHLKACFLYFGGFLEDRDIPVHKLTSLWIAEGFIRENELKSLEHLAKEYLMDLIDRSLLMISQKRSRGGVKACRIHDMLRDFCLSKAKEDNFLQQITQYDKPYASFDHLHYSSDFPDHHYSHPVTYERHRLCFSLKRTPFVKSTPSGPRTRSLIFFAISDAYPRCSYDISFISHHFKLLRVLDLEDINMGTCFFTGIELLIQLRYLAVSGDVDSIPPSIANLWKLETLIVKGLKGAVTLPYTIWCMERLRHVRVSYHVDFDLQDDKLGNFSRLDNLVTFSWPLLTYGEDTERMMRRLPNLRKLGCKFSASWDSSKHCNQFPRFDFLTQLESLKIVYFGRALDHPSELSLPLNLKKLTLTNFCLPWNRISAIGSLQNLEVLKLLSRAFEGQTWDMREGEFLKLKVLKLDTLNLSKWNASNDHLPNLQQLILRNCKELEGVPFAFGEIPTLEMIEVQFCGQSTEDSVRNIVEEGIEGLKIIINHTIHM
ncbi:hypothetical protein ACH5RR_040013 [Cinchona calisaya]|uniref:Uncharacterized protein n=1 Tax=Cinchona calisaya TaxID=153742 RepID=A0ABD2Y526_9GENT